MYSVRAVFLVVLTVGGFCAVAAPAATAATTASSLNSVPEPAPSEVAAFAPSNNSTENTSLGAEISSFMQLSAAQTSGSVETGMWSAEVNSTSNESAQAVLIAGQTADIESELDVVRQQKRDLLEAKRAGNISNVTYRAEMSAIIGRLSAIQNAINETSAASGRTPEVGAASTESTATRAKLQNLSQQADEIAGPEVEAVARGVDGVDAPGLTDRDRRGPPEDVPGNGVRTADGNETTGPGVGAGRSEAAEERPFESGDPGRSGTAGGGPPANAGQGQNQGQEQAQATPAPPGDSGERQRSDPGSGARGQSGSAGSGERGPEAAPGNSGGGQSGNPGGGPEATPGSGERGQSGSGERGQSGSGERGQSGDPGGGPPENAGNETERPGRGVPGARV